MASVLFVEEHEDVRSVLCNVLETAGHDVTCVGTVADARRHLVTGGHDVLIASSVLPDGSGVDLAERASPAGMKVLLLSGHPDELWASELRNVFRFTKPFRMQQLLETIDGMLLTSAADGSG